MLPTSTKVPDRFTPEGADVTYLIEIPTRTAKARYRRAVTAAGARVWPKWSMIASARAAIDEAKPDNAAEWLAVCDRFEQLDEKTPQPEADTIAKEWSDLSRILQGTGGDFAARVADNEFWFTMAPLIAARCFLIGTETVKFKRGPDGLISDSAIEIVVPEDHIPEIGWRALALFEPSETETKNSASPQPSPPGPVSSIAASTPPDGSEWDILGERYRRNPRLDLPEEASEIVTLWMRCRDPMGGYRHLPDSGGVNAQGTWIMAAFDIVASAVEQLRPKKD